MEHASSHSSGPGLQRARSTKSGSSRLRVMPWQGNRFIALVGPKSSGRGPTSAEVSQCLSLLSRSGVTRAVTPALTNNDAAAFLAAGFSLQERLHLLAYQLDQEPPKPAMRLKRGYRWHVNSVIEVDASAFEPFWQFDRETLNEARNATPSHRFRIATCESKLAGYAVTGRAGTRGYLQRLAVRPATEGRGIGTDLVNDALSWLHDKGATSVMVNTQERNTRAFWLYQHLGFIPQPSGLSVLSWESPI